jgi:hypothetical protein
MLGAFCRWVDGRLLCSAVHFELAQAADSRAPAPTDAG